MKKVIFIFALLIFTNKINAQEELQRKTKGKVAAIDNNIKQTDDEIKKGWDGKMPTAANCPDWLEYSTGILSITRNGATRLA
jgi:hypothetical protein